MGEQIRPEFGCGFPSPYLENRRGIFNAPDDNQEVDTASTKPQI
jgi:hypothetical protein